jgi:surface antigen Omp85-like protein/WD40 repeat protein
MPSRDKRGGVTRSPTAALAFALVAVLSGTARAGGPIDPALRFRVLATEHFVIYFHQGEDASARRLATIAEETWRALRQPLGVQPPPKTHVVLVDQTELANGFATPLPRDTIFVLASWPETADFIGDTDDWLRLVFTHEFTHIVHLDRSESWARVVRGIFGRTELAFPNLFLPTWQIEGLATYEESLITGTGRLHAGDFRAVVTEGARAGRLEPLDRVNGGLTDWPIGSAPYAYGSGFHEYLADRFGSDTLAELAEATARRVPYTSSRVFKRIFGSSLGTLWKDYEQSIQESTTTNDDGAGVEQLTYQGFIADGPRFDRFVCDTCPPIVIYSARAPHGFPTLNAVAIDGTPPRQLATRYLGSTTGIGRDALFFDQQDLRRNTGLYSDLYMLTRSNGRVRRVTSEARLLDPDLSSDGETIVAIQQGRGQRNLVLVRVKPDAIKSSAPTIDTLLTEPDTQFNAPRWSPDGRLIAVERHRLGRFPEIVVVDVATKAVRVVFSQPRTRVATPTWRPDGRAIVAAVAPQEQPFNLVEAPIDGSAAAYQITHLSGGATWPDVSPDGRTLVFVGYTVEGYDLFTMPYPQPRTARPVSLPQVEADASSDSIQPATQVDKPYSPWPTLVPTSWSPIVEGDNTQLRIGAATSAFDVLGYHAYTASATWLVSHTEDAPTPSAAVPDWNLYYAYTRWRPTLWASASNATSFFAGPPTPEGTPTAATLQELQLQAGVILPIQHVRVSHIAAASVFTASDDYTLPSGLLSRNKVGIHGGWATTSAHFYGYSVSPERGVTIGGTAETTPESLGSFADTNAFTLDARAYLPALSEHDVVALRLGGGVSTGNPDIRRTFLLGGPGPNGSVIDFGSGAFSLLRGFGANTFAGSHVVVMNADYRFPIARPQRGIGTWPVFLHTIHAAVFADAGHVWTGTFDAGAMKTSAGAELSMNVVAGYYFPFTATAGLAWGHDGSGVVRGGTTVYARIGLPF